MDSVLNQLLSSLKNDTLFETETPRFLIPYSRINCLKTIPVTAAHNFIAHIWQYPSPGKMVKPSLSFLILGDLKQKILTRKKDRFVNDKLFFNDTVTPCEPGKI